MSRERLQEHFSDLYEGTLDPGLAQSIRARLQSDPHLMADYQQFAAAMDMLGGLKDEEIEIPSFLTSKITDRLDASPVAKPAFAWNSWYRNLGFGALALVAVVSAVLALQPRDSSKSVEASLVNNYTAPRKNLDTIEIKLIKGEPTLMYTSSGPKTVTVMLEGEAKPLKKVDLDNKTLQSPLENKGEFASVLEITATGDAIKHFVIIPGSSREISLQGQGSVTDFLKVISTKFGTTIHFRQKANPTDANVKWDVQDNDVQGAVSTILNSTEYTVSTTADGVLSVESHR